MQTIIDLQKDILHAAAKRYEDREKGRADRARSIERGEWTKAEDANRIRTRLKRKGMPPVAVEALIEEADGAGRNTTSMLERIIKGNQLQQVNFFDGGSRLARAVGRVVIRSGGGSTLGYGTGFMISPQLLMTNNHVLPDLNTAANSTIEFDYFAKRDGSIADPVTFMFDPDTFFLTDAALDFTLVSVTATGVRGEPLAGRGWTPLVRESGKALVGEPVNVIQHPRGEPMQIAIRENPIVDIVDDFLHYSADTLRGSSGAPVCNDVWEIAALHHAGVPRRNKDGGILLKDGKVWDGSSDTIDQIDWLANEGVRISRIVAHVDARNLDPVRRGLYDAAFAAPPEPGSQAPVGGGLPGGAIQPGHVDANGGVSYFFRVNFAPVSSLPAGVQPAVPDLKAAYVASSPQRALPAPASSAADGMADALIDERRRRNEPYYDRDADIADRDEYYKDIDLEAGARALFNALNKHVDRTHRNELSYRTARIKYLYPWVDLHPNGKLASVYSRESMDPREVIRLELERLTLARPSLLESWQETDLESLLDQDDEADIELERSMPFNCEHVVPQSWFRKRNPMRADLHHLFACNPRCNSFRGNFPYDDFDPTMEGEMSDCGQRIGNSFEPDANKGTVARATLYFLIRYPGQIGDANREMQKSRLSVLKDWHKHHKVSQYEKHRNAAIAKVQGNRNPLIDYPALIDKIDFNRGFG